MPNLSKGCNFERSGSFEVSVLKHVAELSDFTRTGEARNKNVGSCWRLENVLFVSPFFLYDVDEHFKRFMKELYIDLFNLIPHGNINIKCVSRKGRPFFSVTSPVKSTSLASCAVLQASGYSRFSSPMDWTPAWWVAVWAWQSQNAEKNR